MKKLLLILSLLPVFAFSQNGKPKIDQLDSAGSVQSKVGMVAAYNVLKTANGLPIRVNAGTAYNSYGDSFTIPFGVGTTNGYNDLLAVNLGLTQNLYALSGSGIWNGAKANNANEAPGSLYFSSVMLGFNDLRRGGASNYTHRKLLNGHTAIFANHFLDTATYAGSGTRIVETTPSSAWSNNFAAATVGGKSPLTGAYIAVSGAIITYTFYGNNIVLACIGSDGTLYTYGTFTVSIDGVSQGSFDENKQTDGISDGVNDNGRIPYVLIFSGLSEGSHTILVTTTSSNTTVFDYFGHLRSPSNSAPLLLMETAYMNATGYATAPANATTPIMSAWNTSLDSLVATFPANYPVYIGKTNSTYSLVNGVGSDNIHPNITGQRQIYQAALNGIASLQTTPIPASLPQPLATSSSPTFVNVTLSGKTQNSILFAGAGGVISQDNTYLSYNDATHQFLIGDGSAVADSYVRFVQGMLGGFRWNFNGTSVAYMDENTINYRTGPGVAIATQTSTSWIPAVNNAFSYGSSSFALSKVWTNSVNNSSLTVSKVVFTDASKNETSTGIGTSSQFIMGDGSLNSNTYALASTSAIHGNSTTTGTATTAVTVTIGSTMANTTYNVSITPRDLLTAVNYYISAQSTTTFTVTFVSALTGSINFDWNVTP